MERKLNLVSLPILLLFLVRFLTEVYANECLYLSCVEVKLLEIK